MDYQGGIHGPGQHSDDVFPRPPDYDSGCFSLASAAYIEKVHSLGTKDVMVQFYDGMTDVDCVNDGATNTGRPVVFAKTNDNVFIMYSTGVDSVTLQNISVSTRYCRFLIWDVST